MALQLDIDAIADVQESLEYILAVSPATPEFDRLVKEGSGGGEQLYIDGNDLANFCWHLQRLCDIFGVET